MRSSEVIHSDLERLNLQIEAAQREIAEAELAKSVLLEALPQVEKLEAEAQPSIERAELLLRPVLLALEHPDCVERRSPNINGSYHADARGLSIDISYHGDHGPDVDGGMQAVSSLQCAQPEFSLQLDYSHYGQDERAHLVLQPTGEAPIVLDADPGYVRTTADRLAAAVRALSSKLSANQLSWQRQPNERP